MSRWPVRGQQSVGDALPLIATEDRPEPPPRGPVQGAVITQVVNINEPGAAFTSPAMINKFAPAVEAMIPSDLRRSGQPLSDEEKEQEVRRLEAFLDEIEAEQAEMERKPGVRAKVLQTAEQLVNGDRNKQYGPPDSDFRRTASFWQEYLKGVMEARGELRLEPHDVGIMMALLKISRITWMPQKADSWIDLAGYAACAADCVEIEHGLSGWPT